MNVKEIKEVAQLETGTIIDDVYARRAINEALDELAYRYTSACKKNTATFTITDINTPASNVLPVNYIKVKGCKYLYDGAEENYYRFKVDGREVSCSDAGEFEITYYTPTAIVTYNEQIPEIHSGFHYALGYYVAYKQMSSIQPQRAQTWLSEFIRKAAEADKAMGGKSRVFVAERWE